MFLSNYHSHTCFCDGRSTPLEFVEEAIRQDFRSFGFSAHSPLPFPTEWNMPREKSDDYIAEIIRLKQLFKDQIEIYLGLEIDYLTPRYNPSIAYFQEMPLDYRIGSVHFVHSPENDHMMTIDGPVEEFERGIREGFCGDLKEVIREFFRSSMRMVEMGGFDIVGHIDKIQMNGCLVEGFDYSCDEYNRLIDDLFAYIKEKELIVEINTKSLGGKGILYPHKELFARLRSFDIPIHVNSDSHHCSLIADGFDSTYEWLEDAGFKSTRELIGGVWSDVGI